MVGCIVSQDNIKLEDVLIDIVEVKVGGLPIQLSTSSAGYWTR